jgi:GT2 family glycosyltransferase
MVIDWVKNYVNQSFSGLVPAEYNATVIIPYKEDRGWLKDAICSIPEGVQILLSQGDGNWPQNFNKALPLAKGEYIRYLHEDDMLAPNCIENSIKAIEEQRVDFIHGNAVEITQSTGKQVKWIPKKKIPTVLDLRIKNSIHSVTVMYHRSVFDQIGGFCEDNKMKSFEEFEFHLRCLKAGLKIGYCDKVLGYYRRHPKQLIRTTEKTQREIYRTQLVNEYK